MNTFIAKGNLAAKPTLKYVNAKSSDEARPVAEMRVYFDRWRSDAEGGYQEEGGFWAGVTIWGGKAETAARVLEKGARVCVFGTLYKERWTDKQTGEPREQDAILAQDITLDLARIEHIALRPPKERESAAGGDALSPIAEVPEALALQREAANVQGKAAG